MFEGNPSLRGFKEEIEYTTETFNEYVRCKKDIIHFAETYFHIFGDKGFEIIKLREYQKKILKALIDNPNDPRKHRILLAGRQSSKTTMVSLYLCHCALFSQDIDIAIMAQKEETAVEILDRIKIAYKELPLWLQQGIDGSRGGFSKTLIALENKVRIKATSTSEDGLRGFSVSRLYLDEFAIIPKHIIEHFYASVYGTISGKPNGQIIISSTPKGINLFYEIWKKACLGENGYIPIRVNWWEMEGRDEEWKKNTIRDLGLQKFSQEFSCLGSDSKINILNTKTNKTEILTIEELYVRLYL